uniref:Uncharacterized protein n=1 Tax=Tanacetum cinerariifolium TaxID=118510 RepID=A0A6L2KGV5_TANCI|nr:hypothetical protein [Tanacetum cinerariifolium]
MLVIKSFSKRKKKTCNNDKNLSKVQLELEKEDEFMVVVVKGVHECRDCKMVVKKVVSRLLEEDRKLEWWFEQDIDKEEKRFKEDEDGETSFDEEEMFQEGDKGLE